MKALVGAFNQEKAIVGAFSAIVKSGCGTDGALHSTSYNAAHLVRGEAGVAPVRVVAAVGGGEAETRAAGGVPAVARGARGHVAAAALTRVLVPHVETRVGSAPAD